MLAALTRPFLAQRDQDQDPAATLNLLRAAAAPTIPPSVDPDEGENFVDHRGPLVGGPRCRLIGRSYVSDDTGGLDGIDCAAIDTGGLDGTDCTAIDTGGLDGTDCAAIDTGGLDGTDFTPAGDTVQLCSDSRYSTWTPGDASVSAASFNSWLEPSPCAPAGLASTLAIKPSAAIMSKVTDLGL